MPRIKKTPDGIHPAMPVVRRLPRYYRFLYDLKQNGVSRVSSGELAVRMGQTASQVRQDLGTFGGFGQQGVGYEVEPLYRAIGRILGMNDLTPIILLGAGNLGRAIANHMDFESRGFHLTGIFDKSPETVGQSIRELTVRPVSELEKFCEINRPAAAILCIPKEAAPELVERLIKLDIRGFWNYSHYDITYHHPGAVVENVHLGDSLMTLSFRIGHE